MNFFERKFTPLMARAIRSQIRAFISDLKANGKEQAVRNLDRVLINTDVATTLRKIYKTVGIYFANDTYRNITEQVKNREKDKKSFIQKRLSSLIGNPYLTDEYKEKLTSLANSENLEQKQFGFNAEWSEAIIAYFNEFLLNKATIPITQTTREQIRQVLIEGEQNGWGVDEIARKLYNNNLTLVRARMIVRTESGKAAFKGRELAKEKSPYQLTTEWIAANDHRTRHSHRLIDTTTVKEGEKFAVPRYKKVGALEVQVGVDYMTGPGDPTASKENVINCRCTTAERVVFDEQDNPIMKRQLVAA